MQKYSEAEKMEHSILFYSSSITLFALKQQVFEVGSLLGINIQRFNKDPIFGMHIQPTHYVDPT